MARSSPPRIVVTAAVIEHDNSFLVTRRPKGVHLAGYWEFPGGKIEPGESPASALAREIVEELDTEAAVGRELFTATHTYPDRIVELHFLACQLKGVPRPALGQEMRWVPREELRNLQFPPADDELIRRLADEGQRK